MKKSLIALLVVVALVISVSVFAVSAEETQARAATTKTVAEILAADYSLETGICPHCDKLWSELSPVAYTGQTATGHYYMTGNLTKAVSTVKNTEVVVHMNGNTLSNNGSRTVTHYTTSKLYFVDAKNGGGKITGATAASSSSTGGTIRLDGNLESELYLYNVDVVGAPSWKQGGAIWVNGKSHLYMYGGTVSGGSAVDRGGNICILSNSTATIAGTVTGGSVTGGIYSGGNIYVETGCTLTLEEGANIVDGDTTKTGSYGGGNIGLRGTGSLIMNGGTVSGGSAAKGGNIFIGGSGSITLNGGIIKDGFSYGTQIGGNICVEDTAKLYVKGTVEIKDGFTTGQSTRADALANKPVNGTSVAGAGRGGNIAMRGTSTLEMTGGTVSGGNSPMGGNILVEGTGAASTRVISGGTVTGGYATNGGNIAVNNTGCGATISGTALVTLGKAKTNGGNVYTIGQEGKIAVIEIKGGTISSGNAATAGGVSVGAFATMTMTDGLIDANNGTNGGANIRPSSASSTINISGGTIQNGVTAGANGGNLFSNVACVVNITGGSFIGGQSTGEGANVCFTNAAATSVLKNATISGGKSSKTGATVGATLYLSTANFAEISGMTFVGGTIGNAANTNGGGVVITGGSYTIQNSTFTGGTAYGNGGALYLSTSGTTTLEKCTVSGGSARYGANIFVTTGTLNLVDTDVKNNSTTGTLIYGGGIYVNKATVNMDKDSTISGCQVMHGASVALADTSSKFNLNGGTISGGQATRNSTTLPYGGNVLVMAGTFTMNSGLITGGKVNNTTATNGGGNGGNIYISGGEFILNDGTITAGGPGSAAALKGPMSGGNVYMIGGKFTMNGGTVSAGTAKNNGGNFYITGIAADAENNIEASGATLDINGGTIEGGTAATGGSIYINALAAAVTMDNATISGGKATSTTSGMGGGNIWNALGTTTITKCTISGGIAEGAQGGNIFNNATGLYVDTCRIENGVAGIRVETEGTDAEGNPTVTVTYPNGNGRGGNYAQIAGSATFNYCVIKDGVNYSTTGGGGNIYLNGTIGETKFDGCTITDGFSQNNGGNIQHHAAGTLVIDGDSYVAGGTLGANFGANISVTNGGAILKIDGNTEINATGCTGYGAHGGINIHVEQPNAKLHLLGNSRVILGSVANYHSIYVRTISRSGSSGNYTYTNGNGKVYLGGNVFMDKYVELFTWSTTQNVPADFVEVMEGFTGDALLISVNNSTFTTVDNGVVGLSGKPVNFGDEAPAYLSAGAGYKNTGTVKVHSQGRSGYVTVYNEETGKFTIAPYTAFIAMNNGAKQAESAHVEVGLANFDTLPAGTGYVKLYTNTALTLNENLDKMPIDLNNQVITIDPNGYTLAPIDYRTDGGVVAGTTKLTVAEEDEANIQLLVKNPVTNYQYLNVKGTDGKWTSNRIRVEMTKVSIRPSADGIYYTTRIVTNANAAPALVDFGTAVSLVNEVDENFLDDETVLYTSKALNVTGAVNETARSALIAGILAEGEDNEARGSMKIYANSYVTAMINGREVKVMADESYDLSMKEIMVKLDAKVAELHHTDPVANADTINGAVAFYKKWDVFATWGLTKLAELAA